MFIMILDDSPVVLNCDGFHANDAIEDENPGIPSHPPFLFHLLGLPLG
jgi:hypothetical protein